MKKRFAVKAQVGVEYMIIVGFVTVAIISILGFAYFYSNQIKDQIKANQLESFATQLINSAESVFFSGEPSKTTISLYLPEGVESIVIAPALAPDSIVITTQTSSGKNIQAFRSKVPISGTITSTGGIKKLSIEAQASDVLISQVS